jgi:hypothetical protein
MAAAAGSACPGGVPMAEAALAHASRAWQKACWAQQHACAELARATMRLLYVEALAALRACRDDAPVVQQSEITATSPPLGTEGGVALAGLARCSSTAGVSVCQPPALARDALWSALCFLPVAGAAHRSLCAALGTSIQFQELMIKTLEARAAQRPPWLTVCRLKSAAHAPAPRRAHRLQPDASQPRSTPASNRFALLTEEAGDALSGPRAHTAAASGAADGRIWRDGCSRCVPLEH